MDNSLSFCFYSEAAIRFTSPYGGTTVKRLLGSSVSFNWSFSGDVGQIAWGIKRAGGNVFDRTIMTLDASGSPTVNSEYSGRVSGSRTSGQAIFTLNTITLNNDKSYGCKINPKSDPLDTPKFDYIRLVVAGE